MNLDDFLERPATKDLIPECKEIEKATPVPVPNAPGCENRTGRWGSNDRVEERVHEHPQTKSENPLSVKPNQMIEPLGHSQRANV